jgi:hypothetical protein
MKKLQKSDKHEVATAAMNNGRIAESYAAHQLCFVEKRGGLLAMTMALGSDILAT